MTDSYKNQGISFSTQETLKSSSTSEQEELQDSLPGGLIIKKKQNHVRRINTKIP